MRESNNKHVVIIRMHYPKDDPRFDYRLSFFKAILLPRLLSQTVQNFDIAIRCNQKHAEIINKILPGKIFAFWATREGEEFMRPQDKFRSKKYFIDFVPYEHLIGLRKYEIQSGIDSDDIILRDDYIEQIQHYCRTYSGGESFHLSFQPYMLELKTLRTYRCPYRYHSRKGSAFLSLYQPKLDDDYKFLYHQSHLTMYEHAIASMTVSEGYVCFCVHGQNASTYIQDNAEQIKL